MPESSEGEKHPSPERGQDLVTRDTPVQVAWRLCSEEPVTIARSANIKDLAERIVECRGVNTVAVVNEDGRLVGVIPVRLLLDELFFRVAPEGFLTRILSDGDMGELSKISTAQTAGELMEAPAFVTMDDSVGDAYEIMRERRLEGVPIVDAEKKPVGYLDRFQLLSIWLETHRSKKEG
ncbi:MAG: CBS domain-containing protein [Dehalococcoidia bacterium]|nr:CBS domain-containing protein [Dehalococcoidia bacterium]